MGPGAGLLERWCAVADELKPRRAENVHAAPTRCETCGGDRYVIVATRSEGRSEVDEYAACPDCNSTADTSFYRADGTRARALDSAQVRERLRR